MASLSSQFYGRMFPFLPAASHSENDLNDLVHDRATRAEEFKKELSDLISNAGPTGEALSDQLTQISKLIENAKIDRARADTPEGMSTSTSNSQRRRSIKQLKR